MTRKDYIVFAEMFATCAPALPARLAYTSSPIDAGEATRDDTWQHAARACADIFERDNPRFDRERFMVACAGE